MKGINMNNVKCKVKINRIIYPKGKLSYGDWGIVSLHLIEEIEGNIKVSNYDDTFIAKGNLPEIDMYSTYDFVGKYVYDEKYGEQYEIIFMGEETVVDFTDIEKQKIFLNRIITPLQIEMLYKTLSNPFEAIQNENVKELTKVSGIGVATALRIINKFKAHIDYSGVYIELDKYGLTPTMIHKLIDNYGDPNLVIQKVKENPYILAEEVDGIGWHKADIIALKNGMDVMSEERISAYIVYYLNQQSANGNNWVYPNDLFTAVDELLEEELDVEFLKSILYNLFEKEVLFWTEDKSFICLKKYYELEKNIALELNRLLGAKNNFKYNNYEKIIKAIEYNQGWSFTEEQLEAVKLILNQNICVVCGYGGTGKTSAVKLAIEILKNYSVAQCALAGRASARLTEVTGQQGYTIHKLLGYNPANGFEFNSDNPLPYDIIILDETSMVGADLFYSLIRAVRTGSKLIMLGDDGQLESIGLGNVFKDILDSEAIPFIKLTKIHRQASKSAIITESINIRTGKHIINRGWTGCETRGELNDLIMDIYDNKLFTSRKLIDYFKQEYEQTKNIMDIQIIVPMKEKGDACTFEINNEIQSWYNPPDRKKKEVVVKKYKKEYVLREGDKVINVVNNYKTYNMNGTLTPIFNGYIGIIKDVDDDTMIIDFEIFGTIVIAKEYWKNIELAYAVTVHKKQGDQNKVIIIGLDYTSYVLLTRELVYTAITRAMSKCILCAESDALRYAIETSNTTKKQTFLHRMLIKDETKVEE
jgi:RecD/TraA family predicted helicase